MSFPLVAAREGRAGGLAKDKYPLLWEYTGRLEEEKGNREAAKRVGDEGQGKGVL